MYRVWDFVTNYSILLVLGAVIALLWVNLDPQSYQAMVEYPIWFNDLVGYDLQRWQATLAAHSLDPAGFGNPGGAEKVLTAHYFVNNILMAFFFAIAGKEVWEAVVLKNGSLRGKKAATPLVATVGGILGPIAVYLGLASILGSTTYDALANGWAIPTATDIAFSYLVGRIVFGAGHPAVRFLLLLAIADDAAGLIILAVFYPEGEVAPIWLLLSLISAVAVYLLANWLPRRMDRGDQLRMHSTRVRRRLKWWPYLFAGVLSWFGFAQAGLHPALGLLPIVPTLPHADRAFGIFAEAEAYLHDLLNEVEQLLKHPVEIVLFLFGLFNAGVEFSSIGAPTWLVLAGLTLGKPLGVLLFGYIGAHILRLGLPAGMRTVDLFVVGCVAAIGFTVSLFLASVAFEPGPVQSAAKMGALLSFGSAAIAIALGRVTGVKKVGV
ncbi:Na+/H+ antiporter NhaA [Jannaschia seohaensis]|uniref:Na(+)/H(+) antiporter NhaA n=1 Tax=Jannaschia seohaensis TaxID=475081 RepID=A0A2Y9C082_9RHOB|nr:Na+/H+ antiporter NhaA [Jannaschia seohaensis]PWJ19086.1 NhaA family Na+:H+ antiporter [Jannaschia seohaensis]SSA45702.1 Na+:H+ antiporter, NhaA family [Jannaschia seohaensis]